MQSSSKSGNKESKDSKSSKDDKKDTKDAGDGAHVDAVSSFVCSYIVVTGFRVNPVIFPYFYSRRKIAHVLNWTSSTKVVKSDE